MKRYETKQLKIIKLYLDVSFESVLFELINYLSQINMAYLNIEYS